MYPYPILFGTLTLYDLCLVIAIVICMLGADRMGIMRGFSVKLQKVLIVGFVGAILCGFFGAVFFQAIYNAIQSGKFELSATTGMTFYGGLIFGVAGFLAVWFGLGKLWCKDNAKKRKTKSGIRRFVTNWLDREQNKGGDRGPAVTAPPPKKPADASKREKGPDFLPEWAD